MTASILTRQGEIGGVYVIDPSFHQAVNFLMGWIIFVGPVVIGILLGGYLHRKIRN